MRAHHLIYPVLAALLVGLVLLLRGKPPAPPPEPLPPVVEPAVAPRRSPPQAPAPTPPPPPAAKAPSEEQAMAQLRRLAKESPDAALALARDLDRRYPGSAHAEEREALVIDALVWKGDIGQARTNAEEFLARHPAGPRAVQIERLTGVHPRGRGE